MASWGTLAAAPVALGVGEAAGAALEPVLEPFKQDAWAKRKPRVLDPDTLADLVAQGLLSQTAAEAEAERSGFDPSRMDRLIQGKLEAPPYAEVLELWRRGRFGSTDPANPPELVTHALAKSKIEPQYWPSIQELIFERLSPQDLAVMAQRGIVDNAKNPATGEALLPIGPPSKVGQVPPMPQAPIDVLAEALAHGFDFDRLAALTRIIGLPASPDLAARMVFRQIIDRVDFDRAIAEGNTRNEWADFLFDGYREILTANEYAELQLRGYYDADTRRTNTAKHGMSDQDSDWLYEVLGRGLSLHSALIGERRGGTFKGSTDAIPDWAMFMLQRGNLRPEVYNLAWAARETYPSYFVTRALLQAGAITAQRGQELFDGLGWPEDVAKAAGALYADGSGSSTDAHVTKAQVQLWNTVHTSFKNGEIDEVAATAALPHAGVATGSVADVLAVWNVERALPRKTLTAAQIKKAYGEAAVNDATGVAWTQDDAVAALIALGYSAENALSFLNI